jgi:hypothetical protein
MFEKREIKNEELMMREKNMIKRDRDIKEWDRQKRRGHHMIWILYFVVLKWEVCKL